MLGSCSLLWKASTLVFHKYKQKRPDCTLKHSLQYLVYIAYVIVLISCCTNQSLWFAWQTNCSRLFRFGQQSWKGLKKKEMWTQKIQQGLKKEKLDQNALACWFSTDFLVFNFSLCYLGYLLCLTKFGIIFYVTAISQKLNILFSTNPVKGRRWSKST